MKKIYAAFLFLLLLGLGSCRVLTKSQVTNINVFARAAKEYTFFPGTIIERRAGLVLEEKLAGAIQLPPSQIKTKIAEAQENYDIQQKLADKFDLSLQLIRQYASLLTRLSSASFVEDLARNSNDLDDNLTGLVKTANTKFTDKIPVAAGQAMVKAIFLVGGRLTKNKQARALKKFIPEGDTLIKITVNNIVEALSDYLPGLLAGDKQKFINTYTNNILIKENKVDYLSLKQYLEALNNYDNLERLRIQCIKAAGKLLLAHAKLNAGMRAKHTLAEIISETQDFIVSLQDLHKSLSKLSRNT